MTIITNFTVGNLDDKPDIEIGILDQLSMHVVNPKNGELKGKIRFNGWTSGILRPEIIYTPKKERYYVVARGPVSDVGLMDNRGNRQWIYKPPPGIIINKMAAGDLNRDGEFEFYVATNKGLSKLNFMGKELWRKGEFACDVEVYETNKSKTSLIAIVNFSGNIQFRTYNGQIINEITPKIKINDLEFIEWPERKNILTRSGSNIIVLNLKGDVIFSYNLDKDIFLIRGVVTNFSNSKRKYLAILADFSSSLGQSMLCIFSNEGRLIFKELIKTSSGLASISLPFSNNEALFVGNGPGKVYKYQIEGDDVKK
jgi:hypothetical protein